MNPRTGQFWRLDNREHKVADDEVMVTLTAEESRFFWNKVQSLNTTQRRQIMQRLGNDHHEHAWLGRVVADFNDWKSATRDQGGRDSSNRGRKSWR